MHINIYIYINASQAIVNPPEFDHQWVKHQWIWVVYDIAFGQHKKTSPKRCRKLSFEDLNNWWCFRNIISWCPTLGLFFGAAIVHTLSKSPKPPVQHLPIHPLFIIVSDEIPTNPKANSLDVLPSGCKWMWVDVSGCKWMYLVNKAYEIPSGKLT